MDSEDYEVWAARLNRRLCWSAWLACAAGFANMFLHGERMVTFGLWCVALVCGLTSGAMNVLMFIGWCLCFYVMFFNGYPLLGYLGTGLFVFGYAIDN